LAPAIVITALAYLHIISAVGWLGGAVLFVSVIAPGLKSFSPGASLEFLVKIEGRAISFFVGTATATLIFGVGLLYAASISGETIDIGLALGLAAYLIAMLVAIPAFRKAEHIAKDLASGKLAAPPAELASSVKRGGMAVTLVVILLAATLMFMVASGFPF
jgi:uncharacterized membrane protein